MAITIKPTSCRIESSLDALADALALTMVEQDSAAPYTATAAAWRTLGPGDEITVRLGLRVDGGDLFRDYGVFRVDEAELSADEASLRSVLHARDRASLLIDHRIEQSYGYGDYSEQARGAGETAGTKLYPAASSIARRLATEAGLVLLWEADDYQVAQFVLQADETVSAALARLLEPLRATRRWYTDAWVDDDQLIVRRRGNGTNLASVDCHQGRLESIRRTRQVPLGEVEVYGGTWTEHDTYGYASQTLENATETEAATAVVQVDDSEPGRRVTETGLIIGEGYVPTTREIEESTYRDIEDADGNWLGRVLVIQRTEVITNPDALPNQPTRARTIKSVRMGYDSSWRLVLRDEETRNPDVDEHTAFDRTVTRYEQITPTDVRTVTTEHRMVWSAASETWQANVKAGFPKADTRPGVLPSSLHTAPDQDGRWNDTPDQQEPTLAKVSGVQHQCDGSATGHGTEPLTWRNDQVRDPFGTVLDGIAEDIVHERGALAAEGDYAVDLYEVSLVWPRPWPYRKGDKITLTNLPGATPSLVDCIITAITTDYDEERATWMHQIALECWVNV